MITLFSLCVCCLDRTMDERVLLILSCVVCLGHSQVDSGVISAAYTLASSAQSEDTSTAESGKCKLTLADTVNFTTVNEVNFRPVVK